MYNIIIKTIHTRLILTNLLILLFSILPIVLFAQRTINLNDGNVIFSSNSSQENNIEHEFLKQAKLSRSFRINTTLQSANAVSVGDTVVLQLFEGENYISLVKNKRSDINGNFTVMLKLPAYPMAFGYVTTNTSGKSLFYLNVPENDQQFTSRSSIYSDAYLLIELNNNDYIKLKDDQREMPVNIPLNINEDNNKMESPRGITDDVPCNPDPTLTGTDPETLNLMIVYTPAAEDWANTNEGGITNTIAGAMAQAQAVLNNQGNGDIIVNVHSQRVDYVEYQEDGMYTDLDRLTGKYDGYMDNVHQLRKQYHADIVSLFVINEINGGLGWLLPNAVTGDYSLGFNTIRVQQASWTTTVIHEIGHNLGMNHEIQQYGASPPTPLFPYAWGWYWTGTDTNVYGTVMSYTGIETPYYSNPNIIFMGQPAGNATSANNAQVFRNTKHIVAFYKNRIDNAPDAPSSIVVSTPTANASAGGATISWDDVEGATNYYVCIYASGNSGGYYMLSTANNFLTFIYTNFLPCSTYYFFVRAVDACGNTNDSPVYPFTTKCATDPTVITQAATSVTFNSVTLNKSVSANGVSITSQGFKYKEKSALEWIESTDGALTGLNPNTQYKFYAYATTTLGTYNGNVLTFTTPPLTIDFYDMGGDGFNAVGNWLLISAPFNSWTVGDFAFNNNPGVMIKTANSNGTNSLTWTNQIDNYSYQFNKGEGFAYIINPDDVANLPAWNGILTFNYPIVTDNFDFPINSSNKYTLLGNPYLGDINIEDLASTGVIKAGYYNFGVSGLGSTYQAYDGLIAPWRGFLAVNTGVGEHITFNAPVSNTFAFGNSAAERITVTAANNSGSSFTILKRNQYSSSSVIGNYDLEFINGNAFAYPQIYSIKNNKKLGINAIGNTEEGVTVPLGIFADYSGAITLTFAGMDSYSCEITLLDYLTDAAIDLTGLPSYDYQTAITGSTEGRLRLYFGQQVPTSNPSNNVNIQAFVRYGMINIVSTEEMQSVKIYNISGNKIVDLHISGMSYVIDRKLPSGIYMVTIQTTNKVLTQKVVVKE